MLKRINVRKWNYIDGWLQRYRIILKLSDNDWKRFYKNPIYLNERKKRGFERKIFWAFFRRVRQI